MPARNKFVDFVRIPITAIVVGSLISAIRQVKRPIRPYTFSTKEADFIQLMGVHGMGRFGQEAILPENLGQVDAAFLETGGFTYFNNGTNQIEFPKKRFEEMAFYHKLIPVLREKQIPILFGDLPFSPLAGAVFAGIADITSIGATLAGLSMATSGNSDKKRFKQTAGTAMAIWGASSLLKMFASPNPDMILRNEKYPNARKAAFYTELAHPERILEIFRNALIAHKLLYYAEAFQKTKQKKPVIAIVMGSGHELISEYLKQGRVFCQKVLSSYPDAVLNLILSGDLKKYYPTLAELTYANTTYSDRVIIDPELKEQVSRLQ